MNTIEFEHHLSPLKDLLFAFALKLTRNQEEAKDLMQETLTRAYSNIHRFNVGTNFKAWMSTIMRNTFINNYRRKRTRNQTEQPIENLSFALSHHKISNQANSNLMMLELNEMIEKLPDDNRLPFLMFYNGFHYDEIAEKMEVPLGTIKSRIFFARKKLKSMIVRQYGSTDFRRA